MRRASRYAGYIRHFASTLLQPGSTTDAVDRAVHAECLRLGVYPSPLLYAGFPKSLCTSVNQVVCHGIPDARRLEDGDIVNVDVSCYVDGHHGDCSGTWVVGQADAHAHRLIAAVREAVQAAIAVCRPGQLFTAIGAACEAVADRGEYSVVREFCGHGIGREFHMAPFVFHHRHEGDGEKMLPGMTFTVEPMFNEGRREVVLREDGWTVETRDGMRSAQWEETLLITEEGVEVLTAWGGQPLPVIQHQQ
jgi:methionyl aminopeptidase